MSPRFKFIQTSDLFLDRDFSDFGDFANTMKKAVKVTFELIFTLAKRDIVDAILIPGNLFDSPKPSPETLQWAIEQLASVAPVKVFISPGNSDPCVDDSVYKTAEWPENVVIFRESSFTRYSMEEKGVDIYGFAHRNPMKNQNPMTGFKPLKNKDKFSILLFHGSVIDVNYPDKDPTAPLRFKDLVDSGCGYAALGHFHRLQSLKRKDEKITLGCYSGVPQGLDFDDEGEKGVLLVSIKDDNREINFLPTARAKFQNLVQDCQDVRSEEEVIERVQKLLKGKNADRMLTRITLTGGVDTEKPLDLEKIRTAFEKSCFYLQLDNKTVVGYDAVAISKEQTTRGFFARAMVDKLVFVDGALERESDPHLLEQREIIELALRYGLDAFTKGEVKPRW
jgi:DNA repair protein SbcD/Mre11